MAKQVLQWTDITRTALLTKVNDNFTELYDGKANLAWGNTFTGNQSIDGNVWIGAPNPWEKLQVEWWNIHIRKTDTATAWIEFSNWIIENSLKQNGDEHLLLSINNWTHNHWFRNNGDVWIGTFPWAKLDVAWNIQITDASWPILKLVRDWASYIWAKWTSNDLRFSVWNGTFANDTTKMIINNAGNVWIGTTYPYEKLDVRWRTIVWETTSQNTFVVRWEASDSNASTYLDWEDNKTMIVSHYTNWVYFYWKDRNGAKWKWSISGTTLP